MGKFTLISLFVAGYHSYHLEMRANGNYISEKYLQPNLMND